MIDVNNLTLGDKIFHRNAGSDVDDLVFVRDWTEEKEPFVLIEQQGNEDWVHISELYPWTGEGEE